MRSYILSNDNNRSFSYSIFFAGLFSIIYMIFEIIAKITGLGINLWGGLELFSYQYHPYLNNIVGSEGLSSFQFQIIRRINYLRPHGIFFDIHTQAFIILSSLLIYFSYISNKILIQRDFVVYFLIFGLLISTSGQNIGLGFLSLLIIFYLIKTKEIKEYAKKLYVKIILFLISIVSISLLIAPQVLKNILAHKIGLNNPSLNVFDIIIESVINLFTIEIFILAKSDLISFLIGKGTSNVDVIGSEAHYLGELISHLGIIGTLVYLFPYFYTFISGYRAMIYFKKTGKSSQNFIFSICLPIVIFGSLIHYSPVNHCTIFIMGFCLFSGFINWKDFSFSNKISKSY